MSDADWEKVQEIFDKALERAPAEQKAYIEKACGGDEELLARVMELLEADAESGTGFLETPSRVTPGGGADGTLVAPVSRDAGPESPRKPVPESVGPFQILEVLGEGGMGVVYLAEQTMPLRRRVAVKVIKSGMDRSEVVGRFESEKQALALMSHAGIARVPGTEFELSQIHELRDGGHIMVGTARRCDPDIWVARNDALGNAQWSWTYGRHSDRGGLQEG